jgi:hypothetical protein
VIPNPTPPNYHPEHPIVLPPGAPEVPAQPIMLPLGSMTPPAAIPGEGSVMMLGYFPGYEWRWVSVNAGGTAVQKPPATPGR